MRNVVIYDSYVFSQVGIMKLISDHIPDIFCAVCTDQVSMRSMTSNGNIDLVIVSVWDYQCIEEVIKAVNPDVKVIIYYEYSTPVASMEEKYDNVVKLISKQGDVNEFLENVTTLVEPLTNKETPIVELPYFREGLLKSV